MASTVRPGGSTFPRDLGRMRPRSNATPTGAAILDRRCAACSHPSPSSRSAGCCRGARGGGGRRAGRPAHLAQRGAARRQAGHRAGRERRRRARDRAGRARREPGARWPSSTASCASTCCATPVVRVKLWDESGRIVYSDEPRLIGKRFELEPDERELLRRPGVRADVSDLSRPGEPLREGPGPAARGLSRRSAARAASGCCSRPTCARARSRPRAGACGAT